MTDPTTIPLADIGVKSGAANHRGSSRQDYETPWEFIRSVEARYAPIYLDLAASNTNYKAERYYSERSDSLGLVWHAHGGLLWLNPPFNEITPWAEKCALESAKGARILFLTPASVDSNWWKNYVHGKAWVDFLSPRISFDGKNPFPKPMSLAVYGVCGVGYGPWRWKP